jgi:UDP-glucose 4-epimerase
VPLTVLATGGAGFVGSHVVAELVAAGHRAIVLDDLSNAAPDTVERVASLGPGSAELVRGDVRDAGLLDALFHRAAVDAVIHLAGLKEVGRSRIEPLACYETNVGGSMTLVAAMLRQGVRRLVFSSSAAVYGVPARNPVAETAPCDPLTPYGRSKLAVERILADVADADPGFAAVSLRYFNPVGAHASGLIGEDPKAPPTNLFPLIADTAAGLRDRVEIYGDDFPTPDGTGIRDFIHVVDLALGHVAALDFLLAGGVAGHRAVNLGRGRGVSVLEAIAAFARVSGRPVPYAVTARRSGDVAECVADPALAAGFLGWRARRGLDAMCADHWSFRSRNL